MKPSAQERVVLVTGSSRGIGAALAHDLAQSGDRVHVVSRAAHSVRALEAAFPGRAHGVDLVEASGCAALVERVLAVDGRLDVVVHAVGDFLRAPLETTTWEDFEMLLSSNLGSAVQLARAVREPLRQRRGCMVFFGVAGLEGQRGRTSTAAYAAAKSALLVYARSLAREELPHGVRVNLLSPGVVPHAGAERETRDGSDAQRVPLGASSPAEIARAVRWLVGPDAQRITGQNIEIAGGWML